MIVDWKHPFGRPPEAAYVILDSNAGDGERADLFRWVEALLPRLNWRAHIYVIGDGRADGAWAAETLIQRACAFLEERGFATLYVHPFVKLRRSDAGERAAWERLVAPARLYQSRAYELQGEARLHIPPIIEPAPDVSAEEALKAAEFFNARLATPSFYLPGGPLEGLADRADRGEARFFLDPDRKGLVAQLRMSHILETVLERVEEEEDENLPLPCTPHLVIDEKGGAVFSCFRQWEAGEPGIRLVRAETKEFAVPGPPDESRCPECIGRAVLSMRDNLSANNRETEGRQACFKLALALSARARHGLAAELAHRAFELSDTKADQAAALLHEGLCLRDSRQLDKAEEALKLAAEHTDDQGLVAYHRGRVQFEWRDYIEALERFEEALESGSEQVPVEDMCFEMALCHINIEEYSEARPYLDRSLGPGQKKPPVSFYRGVCDLGQGNVLKAMDHFGEALRLGPAQEDLGRVLFYFATCLKELGRFEEAIDVLGSAINADPEDLPNHNLLGFCYYKTKQHEKAVECFRRAVEIDPSSGIDWANLGSNLRDLGRIEEAVEMYKKALSLDPTIGFARENLEKLTR